MATELEGKSTGENQSLRREGQVFTNVVKMFFFSHQGPRPRLSRLEMPAHEIVLRREVVVVNRNHHLAAVFKRAQIAEYTPSVGVVGDQRVERRILAPFILRGDIEIDRLKTLRGSFLCQFAGACRSFAVAHNPDLDLVEMPKPLNVRVQI